MKKELITNQLIQKCIEICKKYRNILLKKYLWKNNDCGNLVKCVDCALYTGVYNALCHYDGEFDDKKFASYAFFYIENDLKEQLNIKYDDYYKVSRLSNQYETENGHLPRAEELYEYAKQNDSNLSFNIIKSNLEENNPQIIASLDTPIKDFSSLDSETSYGDLIASEEDVANDFITREDSYIKEQILLSKISRCLTDNELAIVKLIYGFGGRQMSIKDIASTFNTTSTKIFGLINKIQKKLIDNFDESDLCETEVN